MVWTGGYWGTWSDPTNWVHARVPVCGRAAALRNASIVSVEDASSIFASEVAFTVNDTALLLGNGSVLILNDMYVRICSWLSISHSFPCY